MANLSFYRKSNGAPKESQHHGVSCHGVSRVVLNDMLLDHDQMQANLSDLSAERERIEQALRSSQLAQINEENVPERGTITQLKPSKQLFGPDHRFLLPPDAVEELARRQSLSMLSGVSYNSLDVRHSLSIDEQIASHE